MMRHDEEYYRQNIFDYVKEKYNTTPEYLWKRYPTYAILRHEDNNKWYAAVMNVERQKLGLSGEGSIDIIDVKCDDQMFHDMLIGQDGYLPGYHMNKQSWLTILLDGTVPFEEVCGMIDASFMATAPNKKQQKIRPPKEWVIPANPKYYDIEHAFDAVDEIDWKQGRGIKAGDTVFMYVAAPVSAILYKCKVTEADIPYEYADEKLSISALMKIRLLKRYAPEEFTFDVLKEDYGIYAIRGPRGVPNSLSAALDSHQ